MESPSSPAYVTGCDQHEIKQTCKTRIKYWLNEGVQKLHDFLDLEFNLKSNNLTKPT